jgi:hypothetical protein
MFGPRGKVDPVRRLIGSAAAWGGNAEEEALYLIVTPAHNDGKTVYRLSVKDAPVDGFWSISVYDERGHFVPNPAERLFTQQHHREAWRGTVVATAELNCLPTPPGWNYMVRLYRPRPEVLNGAWTFPEAQTAR